MEQQANQFLDANSIFALMQKDEALHPDLVPYIQELRSTTMLNHPLVQELFLIDGKCALINKRYEAKKQLIGQKLIERDWLGYIYLHERPYRFDAFSNLISRGVLSNKEYWSLLGSVWIDSENIWQHYESWLQHLTAPGQDKKHMMDEDEQKAFDALPQRLTVYRGVNGTCRRRGLSWSLSKEKAIWFAKKYQGDNPRLITGKVDKKFVHAYFLGRSEDEIVSHKVKIKHTEALR